MEKERIYWRDRGGQRRAYADLRDYADVGGGREALKPEGSTRATTDQAEAAAILEKRLEALEQKRAALRLGIKSATLGEYVDRHLALKAASGRFSERWLAQTEKKLEAAIEYLGDGRNLRSIGVADVQRFTDYLRTQPNGRGGTLSDGTIRHHLNVLSGLYRRAQSEELVPPGYNPVASMLDKPKGRPQEARWLEVPDAALLLEAARLYRAPTTLKNRAPSPPPVPIYPILATFLLTGGRKSEVLGLELDDVSFDRRTVTFRPSDHRPLKTPRSHRTVRLWPQLEEILRPWVFSPDSPRAEGLLFPSPRGDGMIRDVRKAFAAVAKAAGFKPGEIHLHGLRHTFTAARLQTLDRGEPISPVTVARELGHSSTAMVERIYTHLGTIRHRSRLVEYRVQQHRAALGERLTALRSG
jgi:integrase